MEGTPATKRIRALSTWVDSQTAAVCDDHEQPPQCNQPRARAVARFVLSFLVILLLVMLALFRVEPTSRSVRYWRRSYVMNRFAPFIGSPNNISDPVYTSIASSTICPCSNTALSWATYTQFFTISLSPGHREPARTSLIVDGYDFCMRQILNLPLNKSAITARGCPNMINAAVNSNDQATSLYHSTLMDPVLLNIIIKSNVHSSLNRELNDCVSLMSSRSFNATVSFDWLRDVYDLWLVMLQQFGSNPQSTDLEFWEAANKSVTESGLPDIQVIDNKMAIGMHIDWIEYLDKCNPLYCDVAEQNSWIYRIFGTLAQLGGFGTLILVLIKRILWPLVRIASGWPSCRAS